MRYYVSSYQSHASAIISHPVIGTEPIDSVMDTIVVGAEDSILQHFELSVTRSQFGSSSVWLRLTTNFQNVSGNTYGNNVLGVRDVKIVVEDHQRHEVVDTNIQIDSTRYALSGDYRYGFNGMERDDEVKGSGNSLDFIARMYDPRLGRWLSTDPKFKWQPGWSHYKAFLDNPIVFVDPAGETEFVTLKVDDKSRGMLLTIRLPTSNQRMTDGVKTRWADKSYSYTVNENHYYDFETLIELNIDEHGNESSNEKSHLLKQNGIKDSDYAIFGGDPAGDTKTDWFNWELTGGYFLVSKDGSPQQNLADIDDATMKDVTALMSVLASRHGGNASNMGKKVADAVDRMVGAVNEANRMAENSIKEKSNNDSTGVITSGGNRYNVHNDSLEKETNNPFVTEEIIK